MANQEQKSDLAQAPGTGSELEGQVERISYFNEESGYTVARLKVAGYPEPVTIVGNIASPLLGEILKLKGEWTVHPKFGRQFKVSSYRSVVPATAAGIRRYLASGLIKGIGSVMAARIVELFKEKTLEIIEKRPNELLKIEGIGPKRVEMIQKAWKEQKEIRDLMIFLQEYGVSPAYAVKIFKTYGWDSISVVSRNPYRLATDIVGIGFLSADKIAQKLGFDKTAPPRAEAGILYVLNQLSAEGHVYYPYQLLVEKCREILEVDAELIKEAIGSLALSGKIVLEDLNKNLEAFEPDHKSVYLKHFHVSEVGIASHLARLISSRRRIRQVNVEKAISWVQRKIGLNLAPEQKEAVKKAITEKSMVITGGPGTGKTTIINAVIRIYRELGARILLAAPTGRASKRMSEATGYPARTIHRMLEFSPQSGKFQRDQDHPLEVDVLILDETSMIDTVLMYHLLKAVPSEATLIMVGDVNQLPSVGAGSVLKDIIDSKVVPVVELKQIFRQATKSHIVVNAHRINSGLMPEIALKRDRQQDFYFIEQNDPEQALNIILDLVTERIPRRFHLDPMEDIQVLSPMHKGALGTQNLNSRLQQVLNPSRKEITRAGYTFRLKDKVMQTRNNYEKEVFNGDIGRIVSIDLEDQEVIVNFEGRPIPYDTSELDELIPAYAISVHKSQGSEYQAVVFPILPQHHLLLQRNLIYTAVTRAKKLVVMVGSKRALATGIKNDRIMKRYTYLSERIRTP
ncbi:MAG: ATP-dependent RecD-like DNA helicase [Deltaproteobacteria bacterium]|nr:ATP-dependent RecD-like DNA helicase [Deltaproteobacteria bacterium]MBW2301118.1 ATP-dependent RecD-like DNA helicase [Deltaproteobacteria bacterium]